MTADNEAETLDEQQYRATAELLIVAHSIRRILIWTLVVLPLVLLLAVWLIGQATQ